MSMKQRFLTVTLETGDKRNAMPCCLCWLVLWGQNHVAGLVLCPVFSWLMLKGLVIMLLSEVTWKACSGILRGGFLFSFFYSVLKSIITHSMINSASYKHFGVQSDWKVCLCTQLCSKDSHCLWLVTIKPVLCTKRRNIRSCSLCNRYVCNHVWRWRTAYQSTGCPKDNDW